LTDEPEQTGGKKPDASLLVTFVKSADLSNVCEQVFYHPKERYMEKWS